MHSLWGYAIVFGIFFLKSHLPRLPVTFTLAKPVGNFCFSLTSQQHLTLVTSILKVSPSASLKLLLRIPLRILFFSLTQKCQWSSAQSPSHFMHSPWVASQGCLSNPDLAADLQVFIFTLHAVITTWMFHRYLFKQHIQNKTLIFSMATSHKTKTKSLCWKWQH